MVAAPGETGNRKESMIAVNGEGEVLLTWMEVISWQEGGHLAWQLFDAAGKPGEGGQIERGIPVRSQAQPVVLDGEFHVIH